MRINADFADKISFFNSIRFYRLYPR